MEAAAELAERAFAMTADKVNMTGDPLERIWVRSRTAISLEDRGLTEWAIREYRRIASMDATQGGMGAFKQQRMGDFKEQAVRLLAELLHDGQRDKEAADALSDFLKESPPRRFAQGRFDKDRASVISRMHYFRSEQYRQEANREAQISHLRQGIEADPTDADVLIAMYRLPRADDAWVESTQQNIRQAVDIFAARLERLRGFGVVVNRYEIASELNQIAWLVGNTVGDYDQAVAHSRRSLELRPRSAGSLDTLGRTYFAEGDVTNALKYQRRAVKLEPHSQQIRRQLLEFEQARSKAARK
jgi:tetratricopeptide (TPR) repeat protein